MMMSELINTPACLPMDSQNIFERLKPWTDKLHLVPKTSLDNTPYLVTDLLEGYSKIQELLMEATYRLFLAKKDKDAVEAIATLEKFPLYCTGKGIKGTGDQCEKFLNLDEEVAFARDTVAKAEALESYLNTQCKTFYIAMDNLKKSQYGKPRISGEYTPHQMA
jgi:hypothetical protein